MCVLEEVEGENRSGVERGEVFFCLNSVLLCAIEQPCPDPCGSHVQAPTIT